MHRHYCRTLKFISSREGVLAGGLAHPLASVVHHSTHDRESDSIHVPPMLDKAVSPTHGQVQLWLRPISRLIFLF